MTAKKKFLLILFIVIVAAVIYAVFWFRAVEQSRQEAVISIAQKETYEMLINEVQAEDTRCRGFLTQEAGSFGELEYCRRYIDWAEGLNLAE